MKSKYDSPWKIVIEAFFKHLMEFFFPDIAKEIDWSQPYEFLDKELLAIERESQIGNRIADKLIKVYKTNGEEARVIIHLEIQGKSEKKFGERMFQYYYKIHDKYKMPLMSAAILTDTSKKWRPSGHSLQLWGCEMSLVFPIIKLIDYESEILDKSDNPIAKVIQAHLIAIKTRGNPRLRLEERLFLVKKLYALGYTSAYIRSIYIFVDYAMSLPAELEEEFMSNMKHFEEEVNMPYITSAERIGTEKGILIGIDKGMHKGIEKGIEKGIPKGQRKTLQILIEKRFGEITIDAQHWLERASAEELEALTLNILTAKSIDELFELSLNETASA